MKIQISMNDELARRLDVFAKENYLSRSGLISVAATQYLNGQEIGMYIKLMAVSMRKIADEGKLDDETLEKLQDFERFVKMLTGAK